jgi:murein DD-endopeptidase MepM/ murein hydrolase activator NlpD
MHTLNRLLTALCLLAVLVPPATFALVSIDDKNKAQEELTEAIGTAVSKYQQRSGLQGMKGKAERIIAEQEGKIANYNLRKREVRLLIAKQKHILDVVQSRYNLDLSSKEKLQTLITTEKRRMERLIKREYLAGMKNDDPRSAILYVAFHGSADIRREEVVNKKQVRFLRDLIAAEKAMWKLETHEAQRAALLDEYWKAQNQYDSAIELAERSEAQLEQIKIITEEVHSQVLKMQGELARIDAKLKEKAERELIEKGLLDHGSIGDAGGFKPQFSWPIYGRKSAGFMNEDYKKHFGVPHYGLDIAAAQSTTVTSAADGVVFLVRDGGKTGYSYILIGHRGGYATLYGHVSEALVKGGQDIKAGEAIALSGGAPGTHGAGPMTTGSHLHFEVIKAGVNIDPVSVLP